MGFVRTTDPAESYAAAGIIQGTIDHDRLIVLEAFVKKGKATYREAALEVLGYDSNDHSRIESLRRRGSDLKGLGYITQIGTYAGQAEFKVTDEGLDALHEAGSTVR